MAELKPCPFCGGKARVTEFAGWFYGMCLCYDECRTCGPVKGTKEEAIEAWNRRAEDGK